MGIEFIRRSAPSFKKSWDRQRVILATPDFFTRQPVSGARTAAADLTVGDTLQQGDAVTVQLNGSGLVAMRGLSEVAHFTEPPPELISAVQESYGVARGTVEQVNNIAGVVEISIC